MTKNEYLTLAGEYCIEMEWNHDAIPELAKCLEVHDQRVSSQVFELRDEVLACNMKLIHQNERLVWLIRQVTTELPVNRDWLNPDYEREMRSVSALPNVRSL